MTVKDVTQLHHLLFEITIVAFNVVVPNVVVVFQNVVKFHMLIFWRYKAKFDSPVFLFSLGHFENVNNNNKWNKCCVHFHNENCFVFTFYPLRTTIVCCFGIKREQWFIGWTKTTILLQISFEKKNFVENWNHTQTLSSCDER